LTQRICELLSRWKAKIETNKAMNFYDINLVAEDVAAKLLNWIFDLELENLNEKQKNFPGIDLGDTKNEIAFQVTSRNDAKKIKESLEKFMNGPNQKFSKGMKFFIINNKPNLSRQKYDSICPDFDTDLDILTLDDLIVEVKKIYRQDRERFDSILAFLEEEFGDNRETGRGETVDLYKILLEGSRKYYDALKGPNGRFKNLRISDIILPRLSNEWIETHAVTGSMAYSEIKKNTTEYVGTEKKSEILNVLDALPVIWKKECKHTVIMGAVGMGKTVSLIHCWEKYLENRKEIKPVPVFIELNEFNQLKEDKRDGFILSMIYQYYGNTSTKTREEIWEAMRRPLHQDEYIPSMVLLLDGYNEIMVEKREFLFELNRIAEQCPGIQVIITSRYDMRDDLNLSGWDLVLLQELDHDQIEKYITGMEMKIPVQERVLKVLKNPMMLKLYTADDECKAHEFPKNLEPDTKTSLLWDIAELHREEKDFAKAFSCAREAFSMDNQQDQEVIYKLGIYSAWGGDTDTALNSIERSIELYRKNSNIGDDEHNLEITKKDISKFLLFLTADDKSIEQQSIDEVEKMAADVEQFKEAQNHNFFVETKEQLRDAYEKMKNSSYCISFAWILNMFKLKKIIQLLNGLSSNYKENDAKKKEHSKLTQSLQSFKTSTGVFPGIVAVLFIISYLTSSILFVRAGIIYSTDGLPEFIVTILLLWVIFPIEVILRFLVGKDLFLLRFIMGYVTIFLFLLSYCAYGIEICKEEAEEKEKSDLESKIRNTEIEINNIKDEIDKGERRIKKQLSDIIGE